MSIVNCDADDSEVDTPAAPTPNVLFNTELTPAKPLKIPPTGADPMMTGSSWPEDLDPLLTTPDELQMYRSRDTFEGHYRMHGITDIQLAYIIH